MAQRGRTMDKITPAEREMLDREVEIEAAREVLRQVGELPGEGDVLGDLLSISSGYKIRVSKKSAKVGSPGGYMFTVSSDDYSTDELFDKIQKEYGGGEYRLRVHDERGLFKFNRDITIADPIKKLEAEPAPAAPNTDDRFAQVLLMMQQGTQAMMESMREQQLQASQNMQTMLVEIIKSTAGREPAPTQSPQDFIGLMSMARELFGKSANPLDQFLSGVKFQREMGGGDGEGDGALVKVAELLAPSLAALTRQGAPMPAPVQPANVPTSQPTAIKPGPTPPAVIPQETTTPESHVNQQIEQLQQALAPYMAMLIHAAQVDADPELYAEMALVHVDPDAILQVLEDDARYEQMITGPAMPPEVTQNRAWFDRLRECLLAFINEDADGDSENTLTGEAERVSGGAGQADIPGTPGADPGS